MRQILGMGWSMLALICLAGLSTGCADSSEGEGSTSSGSAIGTAADARIGGSEMGESIHGAESGAAEGWLHDKHKEKAEQQGQQKN